MPTPAPAVSIRGTSPDSVTVYPHGVKVRVAPGQECAPWPNHIPVPFRTGVFEFQEQADGTYRPVIRLHSTWVRMRTDISEELGLGIPYTSLRRLMTAGFIESRQLTPGQYCFSLQSFYRHCAAVKADPDFWTGKNLRRYMEAI